MEETVEELVNEDSVFRVKVAPTPDSFNSSGYQKSDITPDNFNSDEEVKPSERLLTNRTPLVVDILGIRMAYGKLNVKEHSSEIDSFINSEIKRQNIKDTKDNYEKILEASMNKLNLGSETNEFIKLDKLREYAVAQTKLWEAVKENEDLMKADIMDLPVSKMRKRLEIEYGTHTS